MQRHLSHIIDLIPRLRRLAVALVHDRDSADALVQMCLENVSLEFGNWVTTFDVRVPLFRCLVKAYLDNDWQVANRREGERTVPPEPDAVPPTLEAFELALRELDGNEKIAFLLVNLEEASYEDAAAMMGELVSDVRVRVILAQNKVRHSMSTGSDAASWREGHSDAVDDDGP